MVDFPEIKLFQMEQWHLETSHDHAPTHSFDSCGHTLLSELDEARRHTYQMYGLCKVK